MGFFVKSPSPILALSILLLVACNSPIHPPSVGAVADPQTQHAAPMPEILLADSPRTTADGNRFVAPVGWSIRTGDGFAMLIAPEGDSRIVIADVSADAADVAVDSVWAKSSNTSHWPLNLAKDAPGRNGWDQARTYTYKVSAEQLRSVSASAYRRANRWTVMTFDLSTAVEEKRLSQINLIRKTLLPRGYKPESFAGRLANRLDTSRLQEIADFVEHGMRELDIPGVAIGIVQDGKVVFARGFGVREKGAPIPVDADSLFMVASNTKALTTLMLAKLVEQGKLTWETPVIDVFPDFRLGDVETTRAVRIKHLVCACTGLPRQDMEWIFEGEKTTPTSIIQTLATMQPTSAFGELYQYSNLLAAAGGFIGAHVLHPRIELGAAYDEAMQALVLDPLEMSHTTFDFDQAGRSNHASPHSIGFSTETVPVGLATNASIHAARPAGGAWSSVNDMLRYVRMELQRGMLPNGTRYIDEAALLERQRAQVTVGPDQTYGMGLDVDRTLGIPVVFHGGSLLGFHSDMIWLPDHGVGAVILTNSDLGHFMISPFRRRLLEILFDGKPEATENMAAQAARIKTVIADNVKRHVFPADPVAAGDLAPHYDNEQLGEQVVTHVDKHTQFDLGGWKSDMSSLKNDDGTTSFFAISADARGYEFVAGKTPEGRRMLAVMDAQHRYEFVETAPDELMQ